MYVYIYNIHDFHVAMLPAPGRQSIRSGATPLVQFDVDLLVRVPVHMWCTSPRFFFSFFFGGVAILFVNRLPNWDSIGNKIKT